MKIPILEVSCISKTFRQANSLPVQAVRDVSLTVGEHECVGLVGESGCGKSTLARLITRLDTPDSGSVVLCGADITRSTGAALKQAYRNMKMIFQEPRSSFDPRLTLGESIQDALRPILPSSQARAEESERLLMEVGLDAGFTRAYPRDVSGGECQRAAIARAIASKPRLLLCDEATSALDVSVQAQILQLLRNLGTKNGMSFLFISHDLALVSSICQRVYVMYGSEIVEHGATNQIIQAPQSDYTRRLIASAMTMDK
ncbi:MULTISPECIES: ABC transporter ATP-binding protein [unclassified Oscillibacter]|uniref:ABC transporter ATP-binding protein n=1 Tax=unclassified Oscillibacter TaxID=2629304 RepID=UPI0025CFD246|nr:MULTISPECIES: dipeptide/oligopeptide/nickel ABC transporter ATP-binding protein [unclassified Oscillibacter]